MALVGMFAQGRIQRGWSRLIDVGPTMRRVIALLGVTLVAATSCHAERSSSGAPPTVVCGTVLSDTAAGPVLEDATGPRLVVRSRSVGGDIYLLLTHSCERGAEIAFSPATAGRVVRRAATRDHHLAAVVITPAQDSFTVIITDADHAVTPVPVRLG